MAGWQSFSQRGSGGRGQVSAGENKTRWFLISIYASNDGTERKRFLERVNNKPNSGSEDYLFLGGDFNCTWMGFVLTILTF